MEAHVTLNSLFSSDVPFVSSDMSPRNADVSSLKPFLNSAVSFLNSLVILSSSLAPLLNSKLVFFSSDVFLLVLTNVTIADNITAVPKNQIEVGPKNQKEKSYRVIWILIGSSWLVS